MIYTFIYEIVLRTIMGVSMGLVMANSFVENDGTMAIKDKTDVFEIEILLTGEATK